MFGSRRINRRQLKPHRVASGSILRAHLISKLLSSSSFEAKKINAITTRKILKEIENSYAAMSVVHVILDNARYHHAKILQPWIESPERRVKLHFLPPYAHHLNPIERLWAVMHMWVTHNQYYATYGDLTAAILEFFGETLP